MRLFSDGVFAVLITILVLELKPPHADTFRALLPLWPTGLSYAVSYLFIAIVWVNHHHLFGYAEVATSRLVWFNFAHLFSVSLIPFTTVWIADSRLAAAPVALYAAVFVLVNVTYLALCWEAVDRPAHEDVSQRMRRLLRMRSFVTIGVFAAAALVALKWPVVAMALICLCLVGYLRPDIPAPSKDVDPPERQHPAHQWPRWTTSSNGRRLGLLIGVEGAVRGIPEPEEVGHDVVVGDAEDRAGLVLVADRGMAGADAEVGGRDHHGHRGLAQVVLIEELASLIGRHGGNQRDSRRSRRDVPRALPHGGQFLQSLRIGDDHEIPGLAVRRRR